MGPGPLPVLLRTGGDGRSADRAAALVAAVQDRWRFTAQGVWTVEGSELRDTPVTAGRSWDACHSRHLLEHARVSSVLLKTADIVCPFLPLFLHLIVKGQVLDEF